MKETITNCKQVEVGLIPFCYTPLKKPYNESGIPNKMNISLECNEGIIKLVKNDEQQEILSLAYRLGSSISGLMDDDGIGNQYAVDFLEYIDENIPSLKNKRVLEIGCGTGYLLSEIRKKGAEVLGIEPGTNAFVGIDKYNLTIINDFFKASYFDELFDVIIFYCVLEHIYDTNVFMEDVKCLLKKDGHIIFAVPDCEKCISMGDPSMLLHEHWNYYTKESIENYMDSKNLRGTYKKSSFAGSIFGCLKMNQVDETRRKRIKCENVVFDYVKRLEENKSKVKKFIDRNIEQGDSLGIYVPGRIINLLSLCYETVPQNIRFFDDNESLYGTYFPGINTIIENFDDLKSCPPDIILIASYTFGTMIKEKLISNGIPSRIILIEEIFR